jgi:hypothetical protein
MPQHDHTTLWMTPHGVRCVVLRYDDTRYQLRLIREFGARGTIKADLFVGYSAAVTASQRWRQEYEERDLASHATPH